MKTNIFIKRTLLLLAVIFFASCEKENLIEQEQDQANLKASKAPSIGQYKDMLDFPDVETFLTTLDELESNVERHDDAFLVIYGHLSDDDLDEKEDSVGFDEDKPLKDFENAFPGFNSLRKNLRLKEEEWLSNEELDDKNDPDNHYIFDDELRTVVNTLGNVKIGDKLYHITRFGYVTVAKGDFSLLNIIAEADANDYAHLDNVDISGGYTGGGSSGNYNDNGGDSSGSTGATCRLGFDRSRYYYPSSSRRLKGKQKLSSPNGIWGSRVKSKTVHYKKKRGRWKRRRGRITAEIRGEAVNQNCLLPSIQNDSKTRRRRSVKVKIIAPASSGFNYKTRVMQLKTVHKKVSGGASYDHVFWEN